MNAGEGISDSLVSTICFSSLSDLLTVVQAQQFVEGVLTEL